MHVSKDSVPPRRLAGARSGGTKKAGGGTVRGWVAAKAAAACLESCQLAARGVAAASAACAAPQPAASWAGQACLRELRGAQQAALHAGGQQLLRCKGGQAGGPVDEGGERDAALGGPRGEADGEVAVWLQAQPARVAGRQEGIACSGLGLGQSAAPMDGAGRPRGALPAPAQLWGGRQACAVPPRLLRLPAVPAATPRAALTAQSRLPGRR